LIVIYRLYIPNIHIMIKITDNVFTFNESEVLSGGLSRSILL